MPEPTVHAVHRCPSQTFILLPDNRVLDLRPPPGSGLGLQVVDGVAYYYQAGELAPGDHERWQAATGLAWGARP